MNKRKQKCQACQHYPQLAGVCHKGKLMNADYNVCVEFTPMSEAYLCMAEPGWADDCRHLRNDHTCDNKQQNCEYESWPKRRSFWCWLRRHRMYVAGYNYHLANGRIEPIKVCQCNLNKANIPSFVEQLRRTI